MVKNKNKIYVPNKNVCVQGIYLCFNGPTLMWELRSLHLQTLYGHGTELFA